MKAGNADKGLVLKGHSLSSEESSRHKARDILMSGENGLLKGPQIQILILFMGGLYYQQLPHTSVKTFYSVPDNGSSSLLFTHYVNAPVQFQSPSYFYIKVGFNASPRWDP